MRKTRRRGISPGTIIMLLMTVLVLIGYAALMPTLTGNQDILIDASQLVVAIDESFAQLAAATEERSQQQEILRVTPPPMLPVQKTPTEQPAVITPQPKLSFSLCATGSILLNSNVQKALTFGEELRFDLLTDQLHGALSADLSIATLENTIVSSQKASNLNMPSQLLAAIRSMGVNALCLGHRDALNYGLSGLKETKQAVSNANMLPYGMYSSAAEQNEGVLINLNGVQVALLSYQEGISSTGQKQTTEEERSFAFSPITLSRINSDIAAVKQAGAHVVIVSLCWGKPGASSPTEEQKSMAQALADMGADVILGTHSGVLQPVQVLTANRGDGRYHPVLCAYSLGNLMTHDREKRANLASILLRANVVYDPASGSVAFDNLTYTPTYAWRGKDEGKTIYRILLNTGADVPAFVDKDQQGVMSRCYTLVTDLMKDTAIPIAQ